MIIFNKKFSLYVEVDPQYTGGNFTIHSYNSFGCKSVEPVLVGDLVTILPEGGTENIVSLEAILPDGEYEITITADNFPDEVENFTVFYNYLPDILKEIKTLFCSKNCDNCDDTDSEKEYLKVFTKLLFFLISSGLLKYLPTLNIITQKIHKIISEECVYKRYYGKFNFSYKDNLQMFFAYFYGELYNYQKNKIKSLNQDLKSVDEVFMIENVAQCLYSSNISLETLFHDICNLNCDCNE